MTCLKLMTEEVVEVGAAAMTIIPTAEPCPCKLAWVKSIKSHDIRQWDISFPCWRLPWLLKTRTWRTERTPYYSRHAEDVWVEPEGSLSILICFMLKKERRMKEKRCCYCQWIALKWSTMGGMDCGNGGHSSPFGGRMFCLHVPWVDPRQCRLCRRLGTRPSTWSLSLSIPNWLHNLLCKLPNHMAI